MRSTRIFLPRRVAPAHQSRPQLARNRLLKIAGFVRSSTSLAAEWHLPRRLRPSPASQVNSESDRIEGCAGTPTDGVWSWCIRLAVAITNTEAASTAATRISHIQRLTLHLLRRLSLQHAARSAQSIWKRFARFLPASFHSKLLVQPKRRPTAEYAAHRSCQR